MKVRQDTDGYFAMIEKEKWKFDEAKPYLTEALLEYLLVGGYPEYFTVLNKDLWQKRLVGDIIGQGLYRDIFYPLKLSIVIILVK